MSINKETRDANIGTTLNIPVKSGSTEGATKFAASDTNSAGAGGANPPSEFSGVFVAPPGGRPPEITRATIKDAFLEKEDVHANDKMIDSVLIRMWGYLTGEELNRAYKERRLEKRKAAAKP